MKMPKRIIDLHTHLFNARYIPLESIIADAMRKDESILAHYVAKLLERLTDSSYPEPKPKNKRQLKIHDEQRIEKIWSITEYELLLTIHSLNAFEKGTRAIESMSAYDPKFSRLMQSDLMTIIDALAKIDYKAEGWTEEPPQDYSPLDFSDDVNKTLLIGDVFNRAKNVVKKALRVVTKLMDPEAWGKVENYLEFFLTMLNSEEQLLKKVFSGYGKGLPPLHITHYMMDMQLAYPKQKPPHYLFYPTQLDRMQTLQRNHPGRIFGFSAFDPRRKEEDWKDIAKGSILKSFMGFKFYPSLGYKPSGNDPKLQATIDSFFDFCLKSDIPIFVHCTPSGFQTREHLGEYAHPKYWREVLSKRKDLRLCLGHAGGGVSSNPKINSKGWMAKSDKEWNDEDNFAKIVTELCTTYPNVYCEIGNITELLIPANVAIFLKNIERAKTMGKIDILDKISYGSDWHMPDMVDSTRKYLEVFLKIFNESYPGYLEKFFWENAYDFLKLPH